MRDQILERLARRYAASGTRQDLLTCAKLLQLAPASNQAAKLVSGLELGFKGRTVSNWPDELVRAMANAGGESLSLAVRRGQPDAIEKALGIVSDERAEKSTRLEFIQLFGEVKQPRCVEVFLKLIDSTRDPVLCRATLGALQRYDEPGIGGKIANAYHALPAESKASAVDLLSSRSGWALAMIRAIESGRIVKSAVTPAALQRLRLFHEPELAGLVRLHWNATHAPTTAEMQQKIERLSEVLRNGSGNPYEGRVLFTGTCAACHKLFGQGGQIGPDLTTFRRDDIENMLLGIINPNAEIRESFETYLVTTKDGRALSGFLADKDNQVVVLRGLDGANSVVPQNEIEEMKAGGLSLMPEGLLDGLEDQQVRDLFAYLRSTQPLVR